MGNNGKSPGIYRFASPWNMICLHAASHNFYPWILITGFFWRVPIDFPPDVSYNNSTGTT
jgi:hypothetical protein